MLPWKTGSVSICEASPWGGGEGGGLWCHQKMLGSSGLDRDAKHQVGLYTLRKLYFFIPSLNRDYCVSMYQVLGSAG